MSVSSAFRRAFAMTLLLILLGLAVRGIPFAIFLALGPDFDSARLASCIRGREDTRQAPWFSEARFAGLQKEMKLDAVIERIGVPLKAVAYCDGVESGEIHLERKHCSFPFPKPPCEEGAERYLSFVSRINSWGDSRERGVLIKGDRVIEVRKTFEVD